jgi:hypothetical protein
MIKPTCAFRRNVQTPSNQVLLQNKNNHTCFMVVFIDRSEIIGLGEIHKYECFAGNRQELFIPKAVLAH